MRRLIMMCVQRSDAVFQRRIRPMQRRNPHENCKLLTFHSCFGPLTFLQKTWFRLKACRALEIAISLFKRLSVPGCLQQNRPRYVQWQSNLLGVKTTLVCCRKWSSGWWCCEMFTNSPLREELLSIVECRYVN